MMALSKELQDYFNTQVQTDPAYRKHILESGARNLLQGELAVAKELIKIAVHGSMGFETLGNELGKSSKSLHRSFGPNGNPTARTLLSVLLALQKYLGITLNVSAEDAEIPAA